MRKIIRVLKLSAVLAACTLLASCDNVSVYGSVGYSSYGGYGGRYGTSVAVGGRLY
jgi:hypothetical protein